ncbi:ABC transporter substrate-binding protein [Sulfitobacter guttiformis]|uniref:Tungstate ABC transporter, substrate-binding protein TupA n=1 Tax=Sulfitobacter guttiformis TaxID=74349 RepID=J7G0A3_9RHOB|nr:substrate-binding domain-containing protein [Sulfitobacter guttiformis]AFP55432.1 tungstate ABC transporter, substrate-binding protein TupA [Sulfitobacter guttiformis]KIN75440.1 Tungstate ABC transporter, substrate-binding protein TupA [Sulfitobacter guttiformis KCTC 32187]RKE92054.1 tungstate transport system substrate-binding protein [Sulfitobacter guttiformis]
MRHLVFAAFMAVWGGAAFAQDVMRMAVTTSFQSSGLAEILLPAVADDLGIEVQLVVVGTGQALKLGEAGDVDAILVHSRSAEEAFVKAGYGPHRREIMYNDFVLIGPSEDPANLRGTQTAATALQSISDKQATFVSRGDDSGTHKTELDLWKSAALDPVDFGAWYKAVGAGMGAALNTAAGLDAYILSDRASWLNFGNKGTLELLFSGDPVLFNQYAYLPVSVERHPHVKGGLAEKLEGWLTSPRAAELINGYAINGETLFTFNATP